MSGARGMLRFRAVDEPRPGHKWQALFERFWPSYRTWFLKTGDADRPSYAVSARALREHMPQLVPIYERVVDLAGGGDLAARFLSLYCPPPYLTACSQAIWVRDHSGAAVPAAHGAGESPRLAAARQSRARRPKRGAASDSPCPASTGTGASLPQDAPRGSGETPAPKEVALIRNYDYGPHLCDGVILRSRWKRPVLAMTDCLWGVLDGINDAGVAVALAFGGRQAIGEGFGITIVLRYVLETARSTNEAIEVLKRVPVHMAYNVAIVDADGSFGTVYVGPDRPAVVNRVTASANHQQRIEWPRYEQRSESARRRRYLEACLKDPQETLVSLTRRFFEPPLFRTTYDRAWGTLYTSVYHPRTGSVAYRWPDHTWPQSLEAFEEGEHLARYTAQEPAQA